MLKPIQAVIAFSLCFLQIFSISAANAALTINNLPGGGYRIDGYGTNQTATNPQGSSASASGGGAAGLTMGANYPVVVAPPSGGAVSLALAGAAAGVLGASTITDRYPVTIANSAAALTLAGNALMMGSGICGPAAPACLAAGFLAASAPTACAAVGCTFFNAVAAQGATRQPDGSYLQTTPGSALFWALDGPSLKMSLRAAADTHANLYGWQFQSCDAVSCRYTYGGAAGTAYCCQTLTPAPAGTSPVVTAPATNADIVAAVNAATGATNRASATAAQNAAAADAINLALLDGLNMSTLAETAVATTIASSFALQKTSTDALGNTVQELSRNLIGMSPGANASQPPLLQPSTQTVTVTNGSPTATTTTTSGPQVSAPAPGALPGVVAPSSSSASDLCLLHPEIMACADITKLNDLPAVVIPNTNKNITTLTPVALGGPAICPPPLILPGLMGGPVTTLDLAKPICDFATSIRAINMLCGSLASFWIISLGFKQNG